MSKITSSFNSAWQQIFDYCKKSPWKERFEDHSENYLELYCDALEFSKEEFMRKAHNFEHDFLGQLFGVNIETFIEREFDNPEDNVAAEYLKRRRWKMTKEAAACLEEIKDRTFSIYEVIDTKPGEYLILKDILLGTKEVKVFEETGSKMAKPFTYLVSKMIEIDREYYFTGTVFVLGHQIVEFFKKHVKKELKEKNLNFKNYEIVPKELCPTVNEILRKYTPDLFIASVKYIFNPVTILNPNGEETSVNSINFVIKDKDKVTEKLNSIPDFERDEEDKLFWLYTEPRKKPKSANTGLIIQIPEGNVFLGDLEIKGNKLLCNAMTKPASEKLIKILQENLGDLISMPVIEHEDIYSKTKKMSKSKNDEQDDIPDEIKQQLLKQFYDEHLRKSIDDKIPILNNKTPRQCAKSDPERVLRWLEMMEENAQKQIPDGKYDMNWVYEELGLKK